ncbi:MAG: DNA polymerase I, thermostable [Synergistetes bacterium ADurb.BinA166]|nr:MAG: DNA polymerase I, thermostable [Synergistetes bacterium ADurb.BinA166]
MRSIGGIETRRNVLVDGNNLAHRAYYSFVEDRMKKGKPVLCSAGGFPTGMSYGFLTTLASWIYSVPRASSVSVFFDGVPARRLALDPGYKSGRSPSGPRMAPVPSGPSFTLRDGQIVSSELELLSAILLRLGCDVYHSPTEEADDLIASFVQARPGETHFIMSADKDMFQLVDDRTVCCRPDHEGFFDSERVTQYMLKLYGAPVSPSQIRMFKALTGDSSDFIPGIPRLRKKLAHSLCSHRSIQDLYASGLPGLSKAERAQAIALRPRVELNYELVRLDGGLDLSQLLRPGALSIPAAMELCQEDLNMGPIDYASYRLGRQSPAHALPAHDWLLDL